MIVRPLACLAFFAVLVSALPGARGAEPKTVRVGAWNIEWLGSPQKRSVDKVERKADDVAAYVKASGVDVLCLNEITFDEGTADKRANKTLTAAFKQLGGDWQYRLFASLDPEDKVLHTGVAWNASKVKLVGAPWLIPLRRSGAWSRIWLRSPRAIKFSTGEGDTDFVVIPVHMKSNSGGFQKTHVQRGQEARALVRCLGAIQNHFSDDDVLIVGDFNTLFGNESALQCLRHSGFFDLNFKSSATWIKSDRYDYAPFDRVLVPDDQEEFKAGNFTVFKGHAFASEEAFRKHLSDHYLIYTDVTVMKDDD